MNELALKTNLLDLVAEYDAKVAAIPEAIARAEQKGQQNEN